jgi:hypothetical protein
LAIEEMVRERERKKEENFELCGFKLCKSFNRGKII